MPLAMVAAATAALVHAVARRDPRGRSRALALWDAFPDIAPASKSRAGDAWAMCGASGSEDVDLSNWRDFRAKLVEEERNHQEHGLPPDAAAGDAPEPAGWAHLLGEPEPGCLIVAQPTEFQLSQTEFNHAAILMIGHDDQGSLGVILNRPTNLRMKDVTEGGIFAPFAENPLHLGGPVGVSGEPGSGFLVLHPYEGLEESIEVMPGVYTGGLAHGARLLRREVKGYDASRFKFFYGYAGWGAGQLQRELTEGTWWPVAACSSLALKPVDPWKNLWTEILETVGGDLADVARTYKPPPGYIQ